MRPYFERQRVPYPPPALRLVGLKEEKRLKVFAPDRTGEWRFVMQYPIVTMSGTTGPKLLEGDMQVPEGIYQASYLNPVSKFHLSIGLDYPNAFDKRQAAKDKRHGKLGGEIMIHGSWKSIGCLAMGDTAAEDLFVLASDVGIGKIRIVLSPRDFRNDDRATTATLQPGWRKELYGELEKELEKLGEYGTTTGSQLIQYADARVPRPPAPTPVPDTGVADLLIALLAAMAEVAETSATLTPAGNHPEEQRN